MKVYSITDTGALREMNQDFCFASDTPVGNLENLYIVADGMGGHKAGDYASRYTTQRLVASVSRNAKKEPVRIIKEAIEKANELLLQEANEDIDKQGMGTTLVAATIFQGRLVVANVGDSRLYIVNEGIRQITRDHSYVEEQVLAGRMVRYVEEMVRLGKVDKSQARVHPDKNIITRAIGATADIEADFFEVELQEGDKILLCTDGLTNMVEDEKILDIIRSRESIQEACESLVELANHNGGRDNITVMLIEPF